jgi:thiosulfate/3-mercaptopyruvate sulfurtransferase
MSEYADPTAIVSAEWAEKHLEDPGVRFVDVSLDTQVYDGIHIAGAIAWNWMTQLSDGVRRDILGRAELSALVSATGIGPDTHIILYGDNDNWIAAWAYWQLKLHGVEKVSLLDGGRKYWVDHYLPVLVSAITYEPTGIELPEPDFATRASFDDILPRLGDERLSLVDVRSPAEFAGEVIAPPGLAETAQRAGHIPGAVSVPWAETLDEDSTFKSAEELRQLYTSKGVTEDKDVITYGRIGERSSHSWFVLHELLGFPNVRNYDGSWTEWGSLIGVPIENPSAS